METKKTRSPFKCTSYLGQAVAKALAKGKNRERPKEEVKEEEILTFSGGIHMGAFPKMKVLLWGGGGCKGGRYPCVGKYPLLLGH